MIKLTSLADKPIFINPERIISCEVDEDRRGVTTVESAGSMTFRYVKESPQEISQKMIAWQMAKMQYQVGLVQQDSVTREEAENSLKLVGGIACLQCL